MWIRILILCMVVACLGVFAFDHRDRIREERLRLERLREELAELEVLRDQENGFRTFGQELCHAERRRSCRRCPGLHRRHLVAIANRNLLEEIIREEFAGNRLRHTPEAMELRQWIRKCHCCRSSRQVRDELALIAGW